MASIATRDPDDDLKRRMRVRAAEHGRSMEEEVREFLRQAIGKTAAPESRGGVIHRRFAAFGGVELDLPSREPMSEAPRFD